MRATALALIVALGGCEFAVKHPPATAALVGGTIALATCEIGTDLEEHKACGVATLGAAAVLGLVTLTAILLGGKGDTVLQSAEPVEYERPVPQDPTLDQPQPEPAPAPTEPAPAPTPEPAPAS
jgi:hypothetical protein